MTPSSRSSRELPSIAPTPTVLILDDYHVADGSGDVSYVTKTLIARAPERLSVVISSRRVPEIPVGRLRAQGELAELRTRDLQFSEAEISDLFSSGLRESLDQESLGVLNRRSEGWAASLELIRTAVRDRSAQEVREFIRNLSGGQTELYDYLAEEVVGELGKDHQEFLMRTSLLLGVTVPAAAAICEISASEATRFVEQSERLGPDLTPRIDRGRLPVPPAGPRVPRRRACAPRSARKACAQCTKRRAAGPRALTGAPRATTSNRPRTSLPSIEC